MGILITFGTQNGDLLTQYLYVLLIMDGPYPSLSCMTIKRFCIISFNISMYFVSVLAKNGHFDPFWDPKWGFTDPLLIFFANKV